MSSLRAATLKKNKIANTSTGLTHPLPNVQNEGREKSQLPLYTLIIPRRAVKFPVD